MNTPDKKCYSKFIVFWSSSQTINSEVHKSKISKYVLYMLKKKIDCGWHFSNFYQLAQVSNRCAWGVWGIYTADQTYVELKRGESGAVASMPGMPGNIVRAIAKQLRSARPLRSERSLPALKLPRWNLRAYIGDDVVYLSAVYAMPHDSAAITFYGHRISAPVQYNFEIYPNNDNISIDIFPRRR
jgi:hypothetical protein